MTHTGLGLLGGRSFLWRCPGDPDWPCLLGGQDLLIILQPQVFLDLYLSFLIYKMGCYGAVFLHRIVVKVRENLVQASGDLVSGCEAYAGD